MGSQESDIRPLLVLWDVDHTLIETRGVGREAFAAAFERVTGHHLERMPDITGRTEPDIFQETALGHGIDHAADLFEDFADALAAAYEYRTDALRQRGRALPGAAAALSSLATIDGVRQSVLTGNTRRVSEIKLNVFGLGTLVDFDAGAYGSDDPVRPHLVEIAQRRAAERYGSTFDRESTILIGDSPSDVETGRAGGAIVIAVASGKSTVDELREAGATFVLPDLTNARALTEILLDKRPSSAG